MKRLFIILPLTLLSYTSFGQIQIDSLNIAYQNIKDPIEYIKKESIGWKLDFQSTLALDKKKRYKYNMTVYSKSEYAFFLWGRVVHMLGIGTFQEAVTIWSTIFKRELTNKERKALWVGYENAVLI